MANIFSGYSLTNSNEIFNTCLPLCITNCGMLQTKKSSLFSEQKSTGYKLIYISFGKALFLIDDKEVECKRGDLILLKPNSLIEYTFFDQSQHYYICFNGQACEGFLTECNLPHTGVYTIGNTYIFCDFIPKICSLLMNRTKSKEIEAADLFLQLLSIIQNKLSVDNDNISVHMINKIFPAISKMASEYDVHYTNRYFAELCNMSVGELKTAFLKLIGMTPAEYLAKLRISNAVLLMRSSDHTPKTAQSEVGIDDEVYFARLFKKYYKLTPTQFYKQQNLNKKQEE